jgi:hypothetical protein
LKVCGFDCLEEAVNGDGWQRHNPANAQEKHGESVKVRLVFDERCYNIDV